MSTKALCYIQTSPCWEDQSWFSVLKYFHLKNIFPPSSIALCSCTFFPSLLPFFFLRKKHKIFKLRPHENKIFSMSTNFKKHTKKQRLNPRDWRITALQGDQNLGVPKAIHVCVYIHVYIFFLFVYYLLVLNLLHETDDGSFLWEKKEKSTWPVTIAFRSSIF